MNVSRAQYAIIQSLIAATRNADTAFSSNREEQEMSSYDLGKIGKHVAAAVSLGQIENCIALLQVAADAHQRQLKRAVNKR